MGGRALVIGAAPGLPDANFLRSIASGVDLLVAVDGGADVCEQVGLMPDLLVGDFDSASPTVITHLRESGVEMVHFPVGKDASDLDLALGALPDRGITGVVLTCVTGGRLDHQLAVIGAVSRAAALHPHITEPGLDVWLLDAEQGRTRIDIAGHGATVSLLALTDSAIVSCGGMRWTLDHARLVRMCSLGLSNVVEDESALIEVHEGILLVTRVRVD